MNWQVALNAFGGILLCIAIVLLCAVFLWSVVELTRIVLAHRQRMALITRGMHPDQPGGSAPAELPPPPRETGTGGSER